MPVDRTGWKEVTATVLSSTYHYARLRDLSAEDTQDHSFFTIWFTYTVDGCEFEDRFEQFEPLDKGHCMVILYNPRKPTKNSLSGSPVSIRSKALLWIIGALGAALLIYLSRRFGFSKYDP